MKQTVTIWWRVYHAEAEVRSPCVHQSRVLLLAAYPQTPQQLAGPVLLARDSLEWLAGSRHQKRRHNTMCSAYLLAFTLLPFIFQMRLFPLSELRREDLGDLGEAVTHGGNLAQPVVMHTKMDSSSRPTVLLVITSHTHQHESLTSPGL